MHQLYRKLRTPLYVQAEITERTFLFVHVDSRRRKTTPAAAGRIAEKGSDRPRRRCALKLASRISALL